LFLAWGSVPGLGLLRRRQHASTCRMAKPLPDSALDPRTDRMYGLGRAEVERYVRLAKIWRSGDLICAQADVRGVKRSPNARHDGDWFLDQFVKLHDPPKTWGDPGRAVEQYARTRGQVLGICSKHRLIHVGCSGNRIAEPIDLWVMLSAATDAAVRIAATLRGLKPAEDDDLWARFVRGFDWFLESEGSKLRSSRKLANLGIEVQRGALAEFASLWLDLARLRLELTWIDARPEYGWVAAPSSPLFALLGMQLSAQLVQDRTRSVPVCKNCKMPFRVRGPKKFCDKPECREAWRRQRLDEENERRRKPSGE